ncbi:MAG TPA: hypothetical protein VH041_01940 [Caldimonas sp.]|jgi:hypothetical protein|nr:hypothetical protein [Caldimonas sp.]HEX4233043.1 hypothetical protein [Caldimonas sp.]
MSPWSDRWSESRRVLAYSAAAALAFVVLERIELALFDLTGTDRLLASTRSAAADDRLAAEAAAVAARSRTPAAALPAGHRLGAFRLGYEIGWASELAGSFAMSDPPVQARAKAIADAHVAVAREQARRLGIDDGGVAALPSRTLTDFVRLQDRFEADESGLARRVEARQTAIDGHLFLLGASVGGEAARVEGSGGRLSGPSVEAIRRHATLAGIAPAVWQPLAVDRSRAPQAAVLEGHRAAVAGVMAALAAQDAADAHTSAQR